MGSDSLRRGKYSEKKTRTPPRGRLVYGDLEDQNKYYRCSHCGFINSVDRTEVGGNADSSGVTPVPFDDSLPDVKFNGAENATVYDGLGDDVLMMKLDTLGNPQMPRLNYNPVVHRFCAFCGSPAWK